MLVEAWESGGRHDDLRRSLSEHPLLLTMPGQVSVLIGQHFHNVMGRRDLRSRAGKVVAMHAPPPRSSS